MSSPNDPATPAEAATDPASETATGAGQNPTIPATWLGVFLTTATTVFLAELGDKTQLAALLLSAESGRPVVVFVGSSLALICSSLVGVLLGRWLSTVMAPEQLERAAGLLMVALGLWLGRQAVLHLAPLQAMVMPLLGG
jgi:putative Ca2+/H+ antiporter (TMEM165/GDT1 family)